MLSIIISSYQENYYNALEKNIAETIGLPYEIIKIKNVGEMGICEAYNKGALKAKYDYLLFVHEDIVFHTQNWGELLIKHLDKENVGVVGIAGSNYVPKSPIGWHLPDNKYNFLNFIQNNRSKSNPRLFSNINQSYQVFALDGVFMAVKRIIFKEFLFNEEVKGFHGYDLDFSLQIAQKYKNFVISDILIEHFSVGIPNIEWFKNNILIKEKNNFQYNLTVNNNLENNVFIMFMNNYFNFFGYGIKSFISLLKFKNKHLNSITLYYYIRLYFSLLKIHLFKSK